jgi:type VI secretion system protein ImpJ
MSVHNRVIWSEGLFLQPQHFQQQERYFERYVETRCQPLTPNGWGFTDVEFERDLLRIGKFALRRAAGVFPDGTPFRMPEDDPLPSPMDVGADVRDQILLLAVPLRRSGERDIGRDGEQDDLVRYQMRELQTRNVASNAGDSALLEVAALRTRFLLQSDPTHAYACVPLAQIVECRADKQVVLDDSFIPSVMHTRAANRLATLTTELLGIFHQRGEALGGRVTATGRGGSAEFGQFLMLQTINRYEPLLAHFADSGARHPEELFQVWTSAAGELATFTNPSKRPPKFPGYRHDRLRESFEPVVAALRESLNQVIPDVAIPIPLEPRRFGTSLAIVTDLSLFNTASFILAARADLPAEELRRRFPSQLRIGPAEKIGALVTSGLRGVPVHAVPVAPRNIPYHAGFAYFELDQTDELWEQLKTSGGVAVHVAGEFPGLTMEFWAIRSDSGIVRG